MKVQKGTLPDSPRPVWMVLDDDYIPVEPIQKYLHYLDSLERSGIVNLRQRTKN